MGAGTAAALLVTAGDNPVRLRSEAAWAHLCGRRPDRRTLARARRAAAGTALILLGGYLITDQLVR